MIAHLDIFCHFYAQGIGYFLENIINSAQTAVIRDKTAIFLHFVQKKKYFKSDNIGPRDQC
jgi:hypothetical protein